MAMDGQGWPICSPGTTQQLHGHWSWATVATVATLQLHLQCHSQSQVVQEKIGNKKDLQQL